jgi:delta-aminolevulinic acid dehydratase/porphobilinogen synthase
MHPNPEQLCATQTPEHLKTQTGEEAFNNNGLSQRTIRMLKDAYPDLEVRARECWTGK